MLKVGCVDLRLEKEMEARGGGDVPEVSHFLIAVCFALGFALGFPTARFLLDRLFFKVIIRWIDTIQVTTPNGESDVIRASIAVELLIEGWEQKKQAKTLDKDRRKLF